MTIASEITRIKNNIASAYTALSDKGATMPVTQDSANLATTVESVSSLWSFCGIYGNPTINRTTGEVSDFNGGGAFKCLAVNLNGVDFSNSEYVFKFKTGTDINSFQNIIEASPAFEIFVNNNGDLSYWCSSESTSYTCGKVAAETIYWVKLIINGNNVTLSYSTDGETYTGDVSCVNTLMTSSDNDMKIGAGVNVDRYFRGSIFVADSYIKLNGVIWFAPTTQVVL